MIPTLSDRLSHSRLDIIEEDVVTQNRELRILSGELFNLVDISEHNITVLKIKLKEFDSRITQSKTRINAITEKFQTDLNKTNKKLEKHANKLSELKTRSAHFFSALI